MVRFLPGFRIALLLGITLSLAGCHAPSHGTSEQDTAFPDAERVVARYVDSYNRQDLAAMKQLLADPLIFNGKEVTFDELREFLVESWWEVFPDYRLEVTHQLAADDHVTLRLLMSGTARGEFHGHDVDGKHTKVSEVVFFRVRDGRIHEYWYEWDRLEFWIQLGVIESPTSETD